MDISIISILFSFLALAISVATFGWTLHVDRRDRPRIVTKCYSAFGSSDEALDSCLVLHAVNAGRRPVYLTYLLVEIVGPAGIGGVGEPLQNGPVRLEEGQEIRMSVCRDMARANLGIDTANCEMWFEDSVGRRYPILGVGKELQELLGIWHQEEELESAGEVDVASNLQELDAQNK